MVYLQDTDEFAKRFDNFMYGLILAQIAHMPSFAHARKQLCDIAISLERKISIPQVKEKLSIIQEIGTEDFWKTNDILLLEKVRKELRELRLDKTAI